MKPLVSIITPTYNMGQYLPACLRSVAGQTYPEIEHIVVDGASSDTTPELLKEWADGQKCRYISEKDNGMYDAINKGMRMGHGKYLAYLNSDDLYFPWSIETLVSALEDSGADLVYGDMLRLYWDGRVAFKIQPRHDPLFFGFFYQLAQPTAIWRREVFEDLGGFDSSMRYGGDTDFFLRCSSQGKIFLKVNEIVCLEQHRAESLSVAQRHAHLQEMDESANRMGEKRWLWVRSMAHPITIARGIFQQLTLVLSFSKAYRSLHPQQWQKFLEGKYIKDLSTARMLFNLFPKPLLPIKLSVGSADVGKLLGTETRE